MTWSLKIQRDPIFCPSIATMVYANVPQFHIAYLDSKQFTSALPLREEKTGLFH